MIKKNNNSFDVQNICKVLLKANLISKSQAKEIIDKERDIKRDLEKKLSSDSLSTKNRIVNSLTAIDVIVSLNFKRADNSSMILDEEIIFQTLAKEWGVPYQKIDPLKLDLNIVTSTIPRSFALKHLLLPIAIKEGHLFIATSNPFNREIFEDIVRATHLKVKLVVTPKSDIIRLINEFFGFKRSIIAAESHFATPNVDLGNLESYVKLKSMEELPSNDQHIVNAVNHLFSYAFDQRASDIHIEPKRDVSIVRMRIDGLLHTIYKLPKNVHPAIISRIKAMSRLDMAEKRRPQDGRIKTDKNNVEVEIRVSTVPVAFGEKVVMRIMDPDILFQDLGKLGFSSVDLIRYNKMINMPHGIMLVCGPTGSGKSTTLYSTLRNISNPGINIVTIEEPIEMVHEEFNQIAVQPNIDITFSTILRTILRQDPDIIMLGEMRDIETASSAIQAALTGHLVLSTLHTNDAPSSITRLLDLGVPYFLIQSCLIGVVAQRLLRKICPYCIESFSIESNDLINIGLDIGKEGKIALQRGRGCIKCRGTGYLGRTASFEVLPYTDVMRKMTTPETNIQAIKEQAKKEKMLTLRENAIKKMLNGETTYQEVLRVTWQHD